MTSSFDESFLSKVPSDWDLLSFLEQELQASRKNKTDFDYSKVVDVYLTSLAGIARTTKDTAVLSKVNLLQSLYSRGGRGSDKARSHQWEHSRINGRKRKRGPKPKIVVYHNTGTFGSIVHGDVQTVNASPLPSVPRNREVEAENMIEKGVNRETESSVGDTESYLVDDDNLDQDNIAREPVRKLPKLQTPSDIKKFPLNGGMFLEDIIRDYAEEFLDVDELNLAYLSIIDSNDPSLRVLFSDHQWRQITHYSPDLSQLPTCLDDHISTYADCATVQDCIKNANYTEDLWDPTTPEYSDKRWIDNVMEHTLFLLTQTSNLLDYRDLKEGVWDSLYAHIVDACILRLANLGLFMQRKEITLISHEQDPNPFISPNVRYDGIVQTRRQSHSPQLEFAVVELSSGSDTNSTNQEKRERDVTKLLAGCRAILNNLKNIVDHDLETIKKLVVVGILHEGRTTKVYYMSCIGDNLFYLRSGDPRPFPGTAESMDEACDLLAIILKVKTVIRDCHAAVRSYMDKKKKSGPSNRRSSTFL